jgi:hypothetical protein
MPATPFHDQDPFDPEIQQISEDTEKAIYGETGGGARMSISQASFTTDWLGPETAPWRTTC